MGVRFHQRAGISQTLLRKVYNQQAALPLGFGTFVNWEGGGGASRQIIGINNNIWGNSGNGYYLEALSHNATHYKIRAAIRRTWFGPDFQSMYCNTPIPYGVATPIFASFEGSGINPTLVRLWIDGVQDITPVVPTVPGRPHDALPYIHVGGYWPTGVGSTGDTAYTGCLERSVIVTEAATDDQVAQYSAGVPAADIWPSTRLIDLDLADAATATVDNTGGVVTLFTDPPDGDIEDCPDFPPPAEGDDAPPTTYPPLTTEVDTVDELPPADAVIETQRWLVRTGHLRKQGEVAVDDLRVTIKRGVGDTDSEQFIWVRVNRDNKGFGRWARRSLGKKGDRFMIITFGGFGTAKDWQFEFATTDDVEIELRKAEYLPTRLGH